MKILTGIAFKRVVQLWTLARSSLKAKVKTEIKTRKLSCFQKNYKQKRRDYCRAHRKP